MSERSDHRKRRIHVLRQQQIRGPSGVDQEVTEDKGTNEESTGGHALETERAEEFFGACGGMPSASVAVYSSDNRLIRRHHFGRPYLLLGRSDHCDLTLKDPYVSLRHLYLQVLDGHVLVCDLASSNGTYRKSQPVHCHWLSAEESICVGPYVVRLENPESPSAGGDSPEPTVLRSEPVFNSLTEEEIPQVGLELLNARLHGNSGRLYQLQRRVTLLGRSVACKLRLEHDSVSRVHSSLVRTAEGAWIVDLLGRGGTTLDGDNVQCAPLAEGSQLQVGQFRFRVVYPFSRSPQRRVRKRRATSNPQGENAPGWTVSAAPSSRNGETPGGEIKVQEEPCSEELTPSEPARTGDQEPVQQPPTGFSQSFVQALVEQFASIQREQFVQNQQLMSLLVEMVGSVQQKQFDLIRDDLARLQQITGEIETIQRQLAEPGPRPQGAEASEELPFEDRTQSQPTARQSEAESEEPFEHSAADQDGPREPADRDTADSEEMVPDSGQSSVEAHAWLTERMASLEKERNNHWQKIVQALSGGSRPVN